MPPYMLKRRRGLRTALLLSAAVHLLVAAAVLACVFWGDPSETSVPGMETHIAEVHVGLEMEEPISPEVHAALDQTSRASEPAVAGRPPTLIAVPNTIPAAWIETIHRAASQTGMGIADPQVTQASGTSAAGPPLLHGAMKPGETVVYLLDCSGSMGEYGKLDRARAVLLRTLQDQPPGVRFQVVVYNGAARPILDEAAPASAASIGTTAGRLAVIQPVGRSNHLEGLRLAVGNRPNYIVWLTDGDDLPVAKLGPILKAAGKPIPLFLATVGATGVAAPRWITR